MCVVDISHFRFRERRAAANAVVKMREKGRERSGAAGRGGRRKGKCLGAHAAMTMS